MPKKCALTAKRSQFGNRVSHANNKTRRRFEQNLQRLSLFSEVLGRSVRLRISAQALRSVDRKGGFDQLLLTSRKKSLSRNAYRLRNRVKKALAKKVSSDQASSSPG